MRSVNYPVVLFGYGLMATLFSLPLVAGIELGEPVVRNYLPEEYDSGPQVWAVIQDNRGIVYIGTSSTIIEFDGRQWRKVDFPEAYRIRSFDKDSQGRIYFGGSGIFGYLTVNPQGETTYRSLKDETPEQYHLSVVHNTLATSHGVYFVTKTVTFRWYQDRVSVLPIGGSFPGLINDKILIYTPQGIASIDRGKVTHLPGTAMPQETHGRIWIVPGDRRDTLLVYSSKLGFFAYSPKSPIAAPDESRLMPYPTEVADYLVHNDAYDFVRLDQDRLAVGTTTGGILIMSRKGKLVQVINENRGLLNNDILGMYVDRSGDLWAGVQGGVSHIILTSPLTLFGKLSGLTPTIDSVIRYNGRIYAIVYVPGQARGGCQCGSQHHLRWSGTSLAFHSSQRDYPAALYRDGLSGFRDSPVYHGGRSSQHDEQHCVCLPGPANRHDQQGNLSRGSRTR